MTQISQIDLPQFLRAARANIQCRRVKPCVVVISNCRLKAIPLAPINYLGHCLGHLCRCAQLCSASTELFLNLAAPGGHWRRIVLLVDIGVRPVAGSEGAEGCVIGELKATTRLLFEYARVKSIYLLLTLLVTLVKTHI